VRIGFGSQLQLVSGFKDIDVIPLLIQDLTNCISRLTQVAAKTDYIICSARRRELST